MHGPQISSISTLSSMINSLEMGQTCLKVKNTCMLHHYMSFPNCDCCQFFVFITIHLRRGLLPEQGWATYIPWAMWTILARPARPPEEYGWIFWVPWLELWVRPVTNIMFLRPAVVKRFPTTVLEDQSPSITCGEGHSDCRAVVTHQISQVQKHSMHTCCSVTLSCIGGTKFLFFKIDEWIEGNIFCNFLFLHFWFNLQNFFFIH